MDIRKRFFTQRVSGHWNSLPREAVTAPSQLQAEFKRCLDNTVRHMVWFLELDSMILIGPFQLSKFYDSLNIDHHRVIKIVR